MSVFSFFFLTFSTGIYQPGLFRILPNRDCHISLVSSFDSRSTVYGVSTSLANVPTPDICALLATFLTQLPEAIVDKAIFPALWAWCVKPTVERENEERERNEREDEDYQMRMKEKYTRLEAKEAWTRARRDSLKQLQVIERDDETIDSERTQVSITAVLLRLLPPANYSLLVYLLAFFTQVPLCPENGMRFDDIGNMFGHKMLGGPSVSVAIRMAIWLLTRWPVISEALIKQEERERRRNVRMKEAEGGGKSRREQGG